MFRLEVSHLQAPTTFSLPDALPTLGSRSVYICGIHFSLNFLSLSDNLTSRITNPKKQTFIMIVVVKKNSVTRNVSVLL